MNGEAAPKGRPGIAAEIVARAPELRIGWKGLGAVTLLGAGVTVRPDGVVRVPYRDAAGADQNAKLFAAGRCWWEQSGYGVIPYGLDRLAQLLDREQRQVWIAEGESDALALREHYAVWRDLPVDVLGLPGAGTWRAEWTSHLRGYAAVYVFPDGDQAGERMAVRIAEQVRWAIRVRLPAGRDVRDVLQADGPDVLDEAICRAEEGAVLLAGMRRCSTIAELEQWLKELEW